MKKILFIVLLISTVTGKAQERLDTLVFFDGHREAVNIKVNYRDRIEYCYQGEEMLNVFDKSDLQKIIFKSGRVEFVANEKTPLETQVQAKSANQYVTRMIELKESGHQGKLDFRGIKKIHLDLVIAKEIIDRLSGDPEEMVALYKKNIVKTLYPDSVYTEGQADAIATFYIVNADDDGELYGFVEYQRTGEEKPFYSIYINGNGDRTAGTFDLRLLGGVKKACFGYRGALFR